MKKISIIIPCYNAVSYVSRCMDSLVMQTIGIDNLELIFVNDASTDNTLSVLCEWEKKYPESILVINCEINGKQGTARNIGLAYASAKYIGYMDIDDVVELTMFEKLYNKAREFECDLVVCQSKKHFIDTIDTVAMGTTGKEDRLLVIGKNLERKDLLSLDINAAVWNKLYLKDLLIDNNIMFPEGFIYEDLCFSELIKHYSNRIYILEEYLYHHISNKASVSTSSGNWQKRLDWFFVEQLKLEELKYRGIYEQFKNHYDNEFFINYITLIQNLLKTYSYINPDTINDINKQVILMYPDYNELKLVKKLLEGQGGRFNQLLLQGMELELDDKYILELINSLQ